MYLSTDDARSDFFLAAAVYVIGPTILSLVLRSTGGLLTGRGVASVLAVAVPLVLVAAMPLYLMRYRGEGWGSLVAGRSDAVLLALAVAAPIVLGTLAGDLVAGGGLLGGVLGQLQVPVLLLGRVVEWLSFAVLARFLWLRAEYAFRPVSEQATVLSTRAAAATIGAAVAASFLLVPAGTSIGLVLAPVGFAGAYLVARRMLPPAGMEEQWRVYAPLITLALGPLNIFSVLFAPLDFLVGVRSAGMVAGFGLLVIMGLSRGRGGRYALTLGLAIALLTSVTGFQGSLL